MDHINWYPGHMKKTRELIRDNLRLCDMVIEVIDARIPVSSRNPIIDELVGDKPRIIVLNKQDLADPEENRKWVRKLSHGETQALELNCMKGSGVKELFAVLKKEQARIVEEKNRTRAAGAAGAQQAASQDAGASAGTAGAKAAQLGAAGAAQAASKAAQSGTAQAASKAAQSGGAQATSKGAQGAQVAQMKNRPLRMMIVGVPNVGKSSLINRMTGRKAAQTGDRPGVTKGKQWLTLQDGMQLLDTPGILWPKFEDQQVGLNLAYCGSIKDEILDIADLALEFIGDIQKTYPEVLVARYKLDELAETPLENMEEIARKRGFILPGKRIDYERCARTVMDEFRSGKLGRITLEKAE